LDFYVGGTAGKRVLDAGCGTSFIMRSLATDLKDVYSVDNSDISLGYSAKRGMVNLAKADLLQLPYGDGFFDLAVCTDAIEHNRDDRGVVKEIARVLKPGGAVLATVPAMTCLWGPQDEKLGHFRRYTPDGFAALFGDCFQVLKSSYFNSFLFPPVYLMRRLFNLFPSLLKERDELDINDSLANEVFFRIFSSERHLLKRVNFPFGVSAIVIARKK
jgi:SAM-dependent methyltransferase